jgi:signal transduction histidine kinase
LTWLPATAVALSVLAVAAFAVPAAGGGHGRVFAAAGAAAALLLAGAAFRLYRQQHAEGAFWAQCARRAQQQATEQQQRAASWERQARQAQEQAENAARRAREQAARSSAAMTGLAAAADHLVHVQLPAALEGTEPASSFPPGGAGNEEAASLFAHVGAAVQEGVAKLRKRSDDHRESSRLAVLTLARLLQASALRIQAQAAKTAADHPADPRVLESSMRVEHASAQMARNAQSLVVLCGEWPGQQWPDPLALPDVVRAAAGRIMSYQRVNVSGDHGVAADAAVVEPLIHLTAELLANAAQSSPPATRVEVTVQAVQHGAVIEIDDRGIGMEEAQFQQAREILSGSRQVSLGDLGEIPQTGLAVVGHYVRRHGFQVELRKSPYGGVRAVVLVPDPLVVNSPDLAAAAPAALPPPPAAAPAGEREPAGTVAGHPLPRRHSLRDQARQESPAGQPPAAAAGRPTETVTPEDEGRFLAEYLSAGETPEAPGSGAAHGAENDTAFPDGTEG